MSWSRLPCEMQLQILEEVIHQDYDDEEPSPYFDVSTVRADAIMSCTLVCMDWKVMIKDRLAATANVSTWPRGYAPPTVTFVIDILSEELAFCVLEKAIPRYRSAAHNKYIGDGEFEHDVTCKLSDWLYGSIERGFRSCVQFLLNAGVEPNRVYDDMAWTSFVRIAMRLGSSEIAELLVRHRAELDLEILPEEMEVGYLLLSHAARVNAIALARALLESDYWKLRRAEDDNEVPIQEALAAGNLEMVELQSAALQTSKAPEVERNLNT